MAQIATLNEEIRRLQKNNTQKPQNKPILLSPKKKNFHSNNESSENILKTTNNTPQSHNLHPISLKNNK